ncbi:hypothetical protein [Phnomibacter ginsenosidimutans]|uniref:Lipoprotein n=1 Tax=Phnomibacter ginsenosidimutans TaxID=2676868 RepID=A0A6I6GTH3_9BACT|nr:hypothetical protein [Phnomibacter ginsenosidimutans]QGW28419.1 hypothetical protein GLV81_10205 [Phnomibacter ginsenosidimutans]
MKTVTTFCVFVSLFATGCFTKASTGQRTLAQIPPALLGCFTDDYGSNYVISNNLWQHGQKARYHLLQYNKVGQFFIAQNDTANPTDACLYTRIDIVFFNNMEPWQWGFCLTAYNATTLQEALQTPAANKSNPRKGCNGFPFSRMKKTITN